MLNVIVDKKGRLKVVHPDTPADIITLVTSYVARELSLAAADRLLLPELGVVQKLLTQAQAAVDTAATNETQRAVSATDYATALAEAKRLLNDALKQLKGRYSKNPAHLRTYTLETKVSARGEVQVARPTSEKGWVSFLGGYVTQQTALPEAERIIDPPLSRLVKLNQIVTESLALRASGATQRQIGVKDRSSAVASLSDLMQLAAVALCVTRFDGRVVEDLGLWGFKIVDKTPASAPEPPTLVV